MTVGTRADAKAGDLSQLTRKFAVLSMERTSSHYFNGKQTDARDSVLMTMCDGIVTHDTLA